MKGIDTNVLVRYFVNDHAVQHKSAKTFIDNNNVFLSNLVLAEAYWVFTTLYKLNHQDLEAIFTHLKRLSNIYLENDSVFSRAVADWLELTCDFSDALISHINKEKDCITVTFDKSAS